MNIELTSKYVGAGNDAIGEVDMTAESWIAADNAIEGSSEYKDMKFAHYDTIDNLIGNKTASFDYLSSQAAVSKAYGKLVYNTPVKLMNKIETESSSEKSAVVKRSHESLTKSTSPTELAKAKVYESWKRPKCKAEIVEDAMGKLNALKRESRITKDEYYITL